MLNKRISKFFVLLGFSLSGVSVCNISHAITDWTAYIQPLQHNCNGEKLSKIIYDYKKTQKFPKNLQPSIIKVTPINPFSDKKILNSNETDGFELLLKNATAFGYPITKLRIVVPETEYFDYTVSFANSNFMQLLPKFFVVSNTGKKEFAGTQKLWVEYTEWSDSEQKYILKQNQTLPYASFNQDNFVDTIAEKSSDTLYYHIYRTSKTGWENVNEYMPIILQFNQQNKTITCLASG